MQKYGVAHYDLDEIKELLDDPGTRIITRESRKGAVRLGYAGDSDMVRRVQKLRKNEIYKTMEAEKCPGLWQDVYRTSDNAFRLYIKLQKAVNGKGVIISFKER
ncbi:motility quorum-sensing regulator MqsR [Desulfonema ishimotonii]|uniref:Motility quorum-sensing regulator MqsR n=1 Tax=Desulfonema ishimotonii TaxID=45657 RepID=A0A401FUC0_9BACT|nr:type II toxin-antitoxin system MqsR family toxin [Desulfonema ishimotonii]GBC60566.1 motility quorum-sensing regulator MqsR [Desulfonema ishimotonii]